MRSVMVARLAAVLLVGLAAGCTSIGPIFEPRDGAPLIPVHPDSISDAVPRQDKVTRAGNKNPYTVHGKTYHLLPTARGYSAEGVASWYGTKFHGRPTANGERYSLYGMTAAHRTLPIPAYVKVTNLNNGRSAVVRVNDRGPFHEERIIDLSYAAAVKLGFADRGVAPVRVEVVDAQGRPTAKPTVASADKRPASGSTASAGPQRSTQSRDAPEREAYFLQVAAFKSLKLARRLRAELVLTTNQEVQVASSEPTGYYRVQVGPLDHISKVQALSELLMEEGHGKPQLLRN